MPKISRTIRLALAVWCGILQAQAATYYVSPAGDDANTAAQAQNIGTPWRTINRAASTMVAGDTCLIRAGTYRETVTVAASGTSGAPIAFQSYGNESVTIDGTDSLTTWTNTGGNIWTAPMGWTLGNGDQIFINGAMMPAARWPNAGASFPWQQFHQTFDRLVLPRYRWLHQRHQWLVHGHRAARACRRLLDRSHRPHPLRQRLDHESFDGDSLHGCQQEDRHQG